MTLLHPSVQVQEIYPIGSIIEATCPPNDNWIKCEGQLLSRVTYANLLASLPTDNPYPWQYSYITRPLGTNHDSYGLLDMVYTGSRWTAVGESGRFSYSDNGETWTQGTMPSTSNDYWSIAWNGSIMVAVPIGGNASATSTNGSSWTGRTLPASANWYCITWDGTYFIIGADNNTQCYRSTDGINWSATGTFQYGPRLMASDGSGVTVALDSTHQLMRSSDGGANWTYLGNIPKIDIGLQWSWRLSYANGYFILPNQYNSGHTFYSTDGLEWKMLWMDNGEALLRTVYSNWQPNDQNPSANRWYYFKDKWFGLTTGELGCISDDMKTVQFWSMAMGNLGTPSIAGYNSSTGKIFVLDTWYRYVTYFEEYAFDETTYFQLPRKIHERFGVNNLHYFIRAK